MDHQLTVNRKRYNEAVREFGLDTDAADAIWAYASSVGMTIDDFTLSILLYGARQEKSARDVQAGMRSEIERFAKSVDQVKAAAEMELEAKGRELMSKAIETMAGDAKAALADAVEKVAHSRVDEVRAYQKRSNRAVAAACAGGVVLTSAAVFAGGYVLGRDNVAVVANDLGVLAKNESAKDWIAIASIPSNGEAIKEFCYRGSPNLTSVEGRMQCTLPVWLTDSGASISRGVKGGLRNSIAQLETWLMTSSWWQLLMIGAIGALTLRKALRNVALVRPVGWLLDIPKRE